MRQVTSETKMTNARTQRDRLLDLLKAGRGAWIPLPEILALGIAQYSARICELRKLGYRVENRRERVDGVQHTYFRVNGTMNGTTAVSIAPPKQEHSAEPGRVEQAREWIARARVEPTEPSLFGDLRPDRSYQE